MSRPYASRDYVREPDDISRCATCAALLPEACRSVVCATCQHAATQAREAWRARPVRHIAGYVPPKGSIAWTLLANVIQPVRGLGV